MSEGPWEYFKGRRAVMQAHRAENRVMFPERLQKLGVKWDSSNGNAHMMISSEKVGRVDFWPGTTYFKFKGGSGHGFENLLRVLEVGPYAKENK